MNEFMYTSDAGKTPLTLEEVLNLMGNNLERKATYLIPDLQRDYVWDSKKIINLIDTLMKGWPFGQILVANTGKMSPSFSPRTFYSKVVIFENEHGETMDAEINDDKTTLILDGQQRLQSLFLGLAPCSGGLVQDQRDWIREYSPGKDYYVRWGYKAPPAFLALNIENLCAAYEALAIRTTGKAKITKLDYSAQAKLPIIEWVFKNEISDSVLWKRRAHLPRFMKAWGEDNTDKYVLLKDIWNMESNAKLEEEHLIGKDVKLAFEAFCERLRALKKVPVPHLCVSPREKCGMCEDEYNEMILSIFTRLNAGGEPLTEEEITYSWIKRYWTKKDMKAETALDELKNQKLADMGIELKSSTLVRILSNIWAVFERNGQELTVVDMLNGEMLKKVAAFLGNNWDSITKQLVDIAGILKKHELFYGSQYYSLQGYVLLSSWTIVGRLWHDRHYGARVKEKLNFNSLFGEWIADRIDRFVFACQWSNSLGDYYSDLSELHDAMDATDSFEKAYSLMSDWFEDHLKLYVIRSKETVKDLNRTTRAGVSAYTTQLWCWQRLTKDRRMLSEKLAKEQDGITVGRPNVDHCVSFAFWEDYLSKFAAYPKGSDIYNEMLAKINQIGNCNILCKSVNCSKNSITMSKFWKEIGFRRSDVKFLEIPEEMFNPGKDGLSPELIMRRIEERTQLIRKELCDFLDGKNGVSIAR